MHEATRSPENAVSLSGPSESKMCALFIFRLQLGFAHEIQEAESAMEMLRKQSY